MSLSTTLQNFPISESKLIDIAKKLYAEDTGTKNPDALAPAFRMEFPIVSLGKKVSPGRSIAQNLACCHIRHDNADLNMKCWLAGVFESSGHLQS